ncbi:hypothetical protein Tco_1313365 [Tanacetum coccineum]
MKDAVNVVVQLKSNKLREEAQAENDEFLKQIDSNIKAIIKDQVKAQVSKIMPMVEKTLKRGRDDQDKDEEPSARSNRGTKQKRSGKEESLKEATQKESKSTSSSKVKVNGLKTKFLEVYRVRHKLSTTSMPTGEHITGDQNVIDSIDMLPTWKHQKMSTQDTRSLLLLVSRSWSSLVTTFGRDYCSKAGPSVVQVLRRNRLMRTDELHKFSDDTLNHVRTALNDIAIGIQMEYLPKKKWSKQDKQRARVMINAIDKKLRDRRHKYSNPIIQPESERSTQGYPLDSVEVLRFYTLTGNPVKEILPKLNIPDHRILKDGGEGLQDGKVYKMAKRDYAWLMISSWNFPRDFAKLVKAISFPQDVSSTSDRRLIELENQVQRLMEAHIALRQPTQVNKITSSCEIYSGPHDTQYYIENPEQAFVEYASLRTDEARGNMSHIMDFTILENIEANIDPSLSHVVFGRPFVEITCLAINRKHDLMTFTDGIKEVTFKTLNKDLERSKLSIEGHDLLSSRIILSEDYYDRGCRKPSNLEDGFYRDTTKLGPEYVTEIDDEGEVT